MREPGQRHREVLVRKGPSCVGKARRLAGHPAKSFPLRVNLKAAKTFYSRYHFRCLRTR